jgi:hypothetical protein
MNKRTIGLTALIIALALLLIFYRRGSADDDWKSRVEHYEKVSDSLQHVVKILHKDISEKDSLLLLYMISIDKTLEELNKEAKKNASVINRNAAVQDSLISQYCRDMAQLQQTPDVCK